MIYVKLFLKHYLNCLFNSQLAIRLKDLRVHLSLSLSLAQHIFPMSYYDFSCLFAASLA